MRTVVHCAAAVKWPGKDDPAVKEFNDKYGTAPKEKADKTTHMMPFCWDYYHPQGCARGSKCYLVHIK